MDWGGEQGKLCAGRGDPDGSSQVPQESLPTWHGLLQVQVALSRLCSADREDRGGRDEAARQGLLWAPPVRWSPSLGASCLPCPSPSPPQCVPALPTVLPLCPRRRPGWARLRLPMAEPPGDRAPCPDPARTSLCGGRWGNHVSPRGLSVPVLGGRWSQMLLPSRLQSEAQRNRGPGGRRSVSGRSPGTAAPLP